jgi:hypothetical protein
MVMNVSIIEQLMIQGVLFTEILMLGTWARQPRTAVIARILR